MFRSRLFGKALSPVIKSTLAKSMTSEAQVVAHVNEEKDPWSKMNLANAYETLREKNMLNEFASSKVDDLYQTINTKTWTLTIPNEENKHVRAIKESDSHTKKSLLWTVLSLHRTLNASLSATDVPAPRNTM